MRADVEEEFEEEMGKEEEDGREVEVGNGFSSGGDERGPEAD